MTTDKRQPKNKPAAAKELAVMPPASGALDALTPAAVLEQVGLIQQLLSMTMKEGEHYGKIPGCGDKSVLLKPGAEKLCLTFRLAPAYEVFEREHPGEHREYRIQCSLSSIVSGAFIGEGVGICSTLESKYRYRKGEGEPTDSPVPRSYWDVRAENPAQAQALIGGKGYSVRKVEGKGWMICKGGGQVENDNPSDTYNTVLKMAKKRALVDAILTATAASDIFTQDIEDIADNLRAVAPPVEEPEPKAPIALPAVAPAVRPAPQAVSEGQDSGEAKDGLKTAPAEELHFEPVPDENLPLTDTPAPWRGIRVHFGKNAGKPLSELGDGQRNWYLRDWLPKMEASGIASKMDRNLIDGLRDWEKCNILLNAIGMKCDGKGFPEKTVADYVRQEGGISLETMPEFPEATLRMILDNFDSIAACIVGPAA